MADYSLYLEYFSFKIFCAGLGCKEKYSVNKKHAQACSKIYMVGRCQRTVFGNRGVGVKFMVRHISDYVASPPVALLAPGRPPSRLRPLPSASSPVPRATDGGGVECWLCFQMSSDFGRR
jgi:hypothetical protein